MNKKVESNATILTLSPSQVTIKLYLVRSILNTSSHYYAQTVSFLKTRYMLVLIYMYLVPTTFIGIQ